MRGIAVSAAFGVHACLVGSCWHCLLAVRDAACRHVVIDNISVH